MKKGVHLHSLTYIINQLLKINAMRYFIKCTRITNGGNVIVHETLNETYTSLSQAIGGLASRVNSIANSYENIAVRANIPNTEFAILYAYNKVDVYMIESIRDPKPLQSNLK